MTVRNEEAETLKDRWGYWEEHPMYPSEDWKCEVASGDTRESYWEWVAGNIEEALL